MILSFPSVPAFLSERLNRAELPGVALRCPLLWWLIVARIGDLTPIDTVLYPRRFHKPIVTVQTVQRTLGVNYQSANRLVSSLVEIGLLREITAQRRHRRFGYGAYLDLLTAGDM